MTRITRQRRQEILEKTLNLVEQEGLASVTIKKIAQRVGFSEAAIYRHFENKQALLLGLMDMLEEMLVLPLEELARDASVPVRDRLLAIARLHARLILEHNSLPLLLLVQSSAPRDPVMINRMQRCLKRYLGVIEALIRQGQKAGQVTTDIRADCMALMIMGASSALAIRHRLVPEPAFEKRVQEQLLPFMVEGLTPD